MCNLEEGNSVRRLERREDEEVAEKECRKIIRKDEPMRKGEKEEDMKRRKSLILTRRGRASMEEGKLGLCCEVKPEARSFFLNGTVLLHGRKSNLNLFLYNPYQ